MVSGTQSRIIVEVLDRVKVARRTSTTITMTMVGTNVNHLMGLLLALGPRDPFPLDASDHQTYCSWNALRFLTPLAGAWPGSRQTKGSAERRSFTGPGATTGVLGHGIYQYDARWMLFHALEVTSVAELGDNCRSSTDGLAPHDLANLFHIFPGREMFLWYTTLQHLTVHLFPGAP